MYIRPKQPTAQSQVPLSSNVHLCPQSLVGTPTLANLVIGSAVVAAATARSAGPHTNRALHGLLFTPLGVFAGVDAADTDDSGVDLGWRGDDEGGEELHLVGGFLFGEWFGVFGVRWMRITVFGNIRHDHVDLNLEVSLQLCRQISPRLDILILFVPYASLRDAGSCCGS